MRAKLGIAVLSLICTPAYSAVLKVGPGQMYTTPSAAARVAHDGDVVEISAKGHYVNDYATWTANRLTIKGIGGKPKIQSDAVIPNGKGIWIIRGDDITISNIEFSGARVRDKNGAALRLEGKKFSILNSYIHHNEDGILSSNNAAATIYIADCEFAYNGHGKGQTHNVYIGRSASLVFIGNFSHHAIIGHLLKSRAKKNLILYNRFMDGTDGKSSYLIDLPNGGNARIIGNILQQGPHTDNWAMVSYGAEGVDAKANNYLYVAFNTFVNNRSSGLFLQSKGLTNGTVTNNIFSGPGKFRLPAGILKDNQLNYAVKYFVDPELFDYHITKNSPARDSAVAVPSEFETTLPAWQLEFYGMVKRKKRGAAYDMGAFEY